MKKRTREPQEEEERKKKEEGEEKINDTDLNLAKTAASFLGKYLET